MVMINTIDTGKNAVVELSTPNGVYKVKTFPDIVEAVEYIDWVCAFYDALGTEVVVEDAFVNEEDLWEIA